MTPKANNHPAGRIILITGTMAAGKSTVAQALAEHLPNSVHLRGDLFRRMIINGRAEMDLTLSEQARQQLQLRYALAAQAALTYADAGWTVVYQDIIIGTALEQVVAALGRYRPAVIVLCPRAEVVAARDQARHKTGYSDPDAAIAFDAALRAETARLGLWLDNSNLTVAQTVEQIVAYLAQSPR